MADVPAAGANAPGSELTRPSLTEPGQRGTTTIADKVVQKIASVAAGEIGAVTDTRSRWASVVRRGLPRATATVAGGSARITVDVAAIWPSPLSAVAAKVRDQVTHQVSSLTGIEVVAVDVTIADVVHLETTRRRVE